MVQSSYKQHVQVVKSAPMDPTFIDGRSGNVSIGAGQLGNLQAERPMYAQYIPGPTDHGAKMGDMVGRLAAHIGGIAQELDEAEAASTANIAVAKKQEEMRKAHVEGFMRTSGRDTVDARAPYKKSMQEQVKEQAAEMGGMAGAKFYAGMTPFIKELSGQVDTRYLQESKVVEAQAWESKIEANVSNALVSSDPAKARQFLGQAYMYEALTRGTLSTEDIATGAKVDQLAYDKVFTDFALAKIKAEGPKGLEEYGEDLAGLNMDAQLKVVAAEEAYHDDRLDDYLKDRRVEDAQQTQAQERARGQQFDALREASLKGPGALVAKSQELIAQLGGNLDGAESVKIIQAMTSALSNTSGDKESVPWQSTNISNILADDGARPMHVAAILEGLKVVGDPRMDGVVINNKMMEQYVTKFEAKLTSNTAGIAKDLSNEIMGYMETKLGLTGGDKQFFILHPEGKALHARIMATVRTRLDDAYRSSTKDKHGYQAAQDMASRVITELESGRWGNELVTTGRALMDDIPNDRSAFQYFLDKNSSTLETYTDVMPRALEKLNSFETSDFMHTAESQANLNEGWAGAILAVSTAEGIPPSVASLVVLKQAQYDEIQADGTLDMNERLRQSESSDRMFDALIGKHLAIPKPVETEDQKKMKGAFGG